MIQQFCLGDAQTISHRGQNSVWIHVKRVPVKGRGRGLGFAFDSSLLFQREVGYFKIVKIFGLFVRSWEDVHQPTLKVSSIKGGNRTFGISWFHKLYVAE